MKLLSCVVLTLGLIGLMATVWIFNFYWTYSWREFSPTVISEVVMLSLAGSYFSLLGVFALLSLLGKKVFV